MVGIGGDNRHMTGIIYMHLAPSIDHVGSRDSTFPEHRDQKSRLTT